MLVPPLTKKQLELIYANEADVLNVAIFGITAKEWRKRFKNRSVDRENIRDVSSVEELVVLANLETLNAEYIRNGLSQEVRLSQLRKRAQENFLSLNSNYTPIKL